MADAVCLLAMSRKFRKVRKERIYIFGCRLGSGWEMNNIGPFAVLFRLTMISIVESFLTLA